MHQFLYGIWFSIMETGNIDLFQNVNIFISNYTHGGVYEGKGKCLVNNNY